MSPAVASDACHVAQINIGTMRAPTDDPSVGGFMGRLDRINALADAAPGFVWRLQTDEGNARSIQIFENPLQLINMSVWESVDALRDYVYRSGHLEFFPAAIGLYESAGFVCCEPWGVSTSPRRRPAAAIESACAAGAVVRELRDGVGPAHSMLSITELHERRSARSHRWRRSERTSVWRSWREASESTTSILR